MIGAVENAILARLKAAADADVLGYRWASLETYPEDWDAYLKDKVALRAPAAWVVFGGWGSGGAGERQTPWLPATFGLVVMAENLRNEQASRHGDPADAAKPGSYQLVEDAVGLLAGEDLNLPIAPFVIGSCRFVRAPAAMRERKLSMLALELRTQLQFDLRGFAGEPDDFIHFHVDWDAPPHGAGRDGTPIGGDPWTGPDPDTADATDDVILPGAGA